MINENNLVVSDRDISKKAKYGDYLVVDIKKGEPFYPVSISLSGRYLCVPAFAGWHNQYPIEWFSEYDKDYEKMKSAVKNQ